VKLVFGVIDIPYANALDQPRRVPQAKPGRQRRRRPRKVASGTQTTGDVAEILEKRYNVMERFAGLNETEIVSSIENALVGNIENVILGAPITGEPLAAATSEIEEMFRDFLDRRGMDGYAWGVPTQAAERGVNHRLLHPYAKRGPRPSFIDTGLYQQSFRCWVEE
jgi:hypothetical protein